MEGCDGALEGAPDELTFRRFSAGEQKLIWSEPTAIDATLLRSYGRSPVPRRERAKQGPRLRDARMEHPGEGTFR